MRPAGLTAVCIICLIAGALGGFSVIGGCVALVAQPLVIQLTQHFTRMLPGSNTPQFQQQMDQQRELMQEAFAVQRPWLPLMILAMVILSVAVGCLLVGAVKGLNLKRMAHRWMIAGMTVAMLHGLVAAYIGYGTQRDSQAIMARHMNKTLQNTPGGMNPAARAMTNQMMQIGVVAGFAIAFGWAFVKACLYGGCIWYLLTPRIRRLFESDGSDRAIIDALSEAPT